MKVSSGSSAHGTARRLTIGGGGNGRKARSGGAVLAGILVWQAAAMAFDEPSGAFVRNVRWNDHCLALAGGRDAIAGQPVVLIPCPSPNTEAGRWTSRPDGTLGIASRSLQNGCLTFLTTAGVTRAAMRSPLFFAYCNAGPTQTFTVDNGYIATQDGGRLTATGPGEPVVVGASGALPGADRWSIGVR